MIPLKIREKIKLTQEGEKGQHAKIDFLQSIKYKSMLDYQVDRAVNYLSKFPKNGFGELALLCDKYGSDKGSIYFEQNKSLHAYPWFPHTYTDVYEVLFGNIRYNVKNIFECGIGTNNQDVKSNMSKNGKPGASLRVWQDYFVNAIVWGADIDKGCLFNEGRIKTGFIDQTSAQLIKAFFESTNVDKFDIMIDDGLHTTDAALTLFKNAINYLADDGIYVIEDLSVDSIQKIRDELSPKNEYIVSYIIMDNSQIFDNNLIIIRKRGK